MAKIKSAFYCQNGANNSATLTAPDGFANYVWSNAANGQQLATGQVANVNIQGVDTVNCQITSANGCIATLTTAVLPAEVIGDIVDIFLRLWNFNLRRASAFSSHI